MIKKFNLMFVLVIGIHANNVIATEVDQHLNIIADEETNKNLRLIEIEEAANAVATQAYEVDLLARRTVNIAHATLVAVQLIKVRPISYTLPETIAVAQHSENIARRAIYTAAHAKALAKESEDNTAEDIVRANKIEAEEPIKKTTAAEAKIVHAATRASEKSVKEAYKAVSHAYKEAEAAKIAAETAANQVSEAHKIAATTKKSYRGCCFFRR